MSPARRALAAIALAVIGLGGAGRAARAQAIHVVLSPVSNDSTSPAPVISVSATPVSTELQPSTMQLELARDAQFRAPFLVRSTPGLTAQYVVDSLLPEKTRVYVRARLFDRFGTVRAEEVTSYPVRSWLALVSPTRASEVLFTRQPQFVWNSPPITLPPGPWIYTLTIFNVGRNKVEQQATALRATQYVPEVPLDACTSYRWSVTARAENGGPNDQITLNSTGTFVIQARECPSATIFYQNFPNPFGLGALSGKTCFWFDLAHRSTVKLAIYDLRLHEVKRLVPGALPAVLDSGAYGRQGAADQGGCDPRLQWDGRDDAGRTVPPGAYIAVFEADGKRESKKLVFKGP